MSITKDDIQKVINQLEASDRPVKEAKQMLKELIQELKWEPKLAAYYPQEMWGKARRMSERNKLILKAKTEMEYGDGDHEIYYHFSRKEWLTSNTGSAANPELTFETKEQAEKVLEMVGLNET